MVFDSNEESTTTISDAVTTWGPIKTEKQIKDFLARCDKVRGFGMSSGNCPAEKRKPGLCAECSAPATLRWVLGENVKASANMQNKAIELLGKGDKK